MSEAAELFDLSGKVALVTGGSRGMGAAMVRGFARAGADVVIASRKLESCERLAQEVRAESGRQALPVSCHVGDWQQVDALAEAAYAEFGKVDVLVNNAGMSPLYDHVSEVSETLYDKVLDVNLKGPFRLTANIGTRMAEGDGGSVIMVSSTASQSPGPNALAYGAAKAGLNNLTVGFARTFAPKVRVNCIIPGAVPDGYLEGVGHGGVRGARGEHDPAGAGRTGGGDRGGGALLRLGGVELHHGGVADRLGGLGALAGRDRSAVIVAIIPAPTSYGRSVADVSGEKRDSYGREP